MIILCLIERLPSRPIIKRELQNSTEINGHNLTLQCAVISDEPPFITWLKHPTQNSTVDIEGHVHNQLYVIKVATVLAWVYSIYSI